MTPKEKAKELFERMLNSMMPHIMDKDDAKQCALILVDEILNVIDRDMNYQNTYSFFLEVKTEIEKL